MDLTTKPELMSHQLQGGRVSRLGDTTWRLEIPPGPGGRYRLAQLDDYASLKRGDFPWRPPFSLRVRVRASAEMIPGTWGVGLWNDPFSLSLGLGGGERRIPALPNAAWFFFASPQNYLSLSDNLPATGKLAATFRARHLPTSLLVLTAPFLSLLALPPMARLFRRLGRRYIHQDSVNLSLDITTWQAIQLEWNTFDVRFILDGKTVLHTDVSPHSPLGLVLWIDNQYAALSPDGRLRYGTLPNPEPAWIEIADLTLPS